MTIPPGWTDDESYTPETEPPQASKASPPSLTASSPREWTLCYGEYEDPAWDGPLFDGHVKVIEKSAYDERNQLCEDQALQLRGLDKWIADQEREIFALKAENERQRKRITEVNGYLFDARSEITDVHTKINNLKAEAEKLAEALEEFADPEHWELFHVCDSYSGAPGDLCNVGLLGERDGHAYEVAASALASWRRYLEGE